MKLKPVIQNILVNSSLTIMNEYPSFSVSMLKALQHNTAFNYCVFREFKAIYEVRGGSFIALIQRQVPGSQTTLNITITVNS